MGSKIAGTKLRLAIVGAFAALLILSGVLLIQHRRHDAASPERQRQFSEWLRECASTPKPAKANSCVFTPLESCQRLSLYALDDMRRSKDGYEHEHRGVPLMEIVPKGSRAVPRPVEDWPAMVPTDAVLGTRDLSQRETESLLELWREQRLYPLESPLLCDCQPSYALACADGENLRLSWSICFFCQKIVYETSQPRARGELLFDDKLPQAVELRQELLRLLPHPHADLIEKTVRLKHSK